MKFSEKWLRTFVDPPLSTRELADRITFGGIEVETVEPVAPPFTGVVAGEVLSVERHPDAERLSVCRVNVGVAPLTIVCGAPNVRPGMRVPAALVGASLPGMRIKAANVRGVESQGMLCSATELGLAAEAAGLLELPANCIIGTDVRTILDLDDQLFTTKPTPNRGDCLSLLGMAREVAALCDLPMRRPDMTPVSSSISDSLEVRLMAGAACPLYSGRLIRGVDTSRASPSWMVERLARSGLRSISAVVDITNYVMLELGQPLHAFDAARIDGGISVRWAAAGETFELLNGERPSLTPEFLLIADERKALALAGIMGGAVSAVTASTSDVFLESAYFDPAAIAGKSRMLGFGSDSSYRFERGVDFGATELALQRASELVIAICGGRPGPPVVAKGELPGRMPVNVRMSRAARVLGMEIDSDEAGQILRRLGFECRFQGEVWTATPPTFRFDVAIEEDLIEEIARVHGYSRIPVAMPRISVEMLGCSERVHSAAAIKASLASRDYQEVITFSFVDRAWEADFGGNLDPVVLANPIASQMGVMRSQLFGSLVSCAAFNVNRKQSRVRLFEVGRCFVRTGGDYDQPLRLGGLAYGDAFPVQWGIKSENVDFYDVKADVEALLGSKKLRFERATHPALHPGKCARIWCDGAAAGWIGELHPRWQQKYDLPQSAILFELDWTVLNHAGVPGYSEVSKFPPVRRDMTAEFEEAVDFEVIREALERDKPALVTEIGVVDVYRGAGVGKGKKSLAFRVLLQDTHKTLTDAEVESAVSRLRQTLQKQFNAKLR